MDDFLAHMSGAAARIGEAHDTNDAPDNDAKASAAPTTGKIFVGGLHPSTTSQSLYNYFVQFGSLSDAIVMRDAVTKRPRGFGFVTFVDPASLTSVTRTRLHHVDGRLVEVKAAVPASAMLRPNPTSP